MAASGAAKVGFGKGTPALLGGVWRWCAQHTARFAMQCQLLESLTTARRHHVDGGLQRLIESELTSPTCARCACVRAA